MRASGSEIAVFEVGGTDLLAALVKIEVAGLVDSDEVTPVAAPGVVRTPLRRRVVVSADLIETSTGGLPLSGLDLSTVEIAGIDHLSVVERIQFRGTTRRAEGAGVADPWSHPRVVQKDYRTVIDLLVEAEAVSEQMLACVSGDVETVFSMVVDGFPISLPMIVAGSRHMGAAGELQRWRLMLKGSSPLSGIYPMQPNVTGSLLSSALVAPGSIHSLEVVSRAVGGAIYQGGFLTSAFQMDVRAGRPLMTAYRFDSVGEVLAAAVEDVA